MKEGPLFEYRSEENDGRHSCFLSPAFRNKRPLKLATWLLPCWKDKISWVRGRSRRYAGAALNAFERIYDEIYSEGGSMRESEELGDLPHGSA